MKNFLNDLFCRLIVYLMILLFSVTSYAEEIQIDGVWFEINKDNHTAVLTGQLRKDAEVVRIPSYFSYYDEQYKVIGIEDAFVNSETLEEIVIPSTISYMKHFAFQYCPNFSRVRIADLNYWFDIKFIGSNPLSVNKCLLYVNDTPIINLVIPPSITEVNDNAFFGYENLKSVICPTKLTNIGKWAFADCINLQNIQLSEVTQRIDAGAFSGCTQLKKIDLGDAIESIEASAFSFSNLEEIHFPKTLTKIGENAFEGCKIKSITIPDNVTEIGNGAFYGCNELISVHLGKSLRKINKYIFWGCKNLANINIDDPIEEIGEGAFGNCTALSEIYLPQSLTKLGKSTFSGCQNLTFINIPDKVTELPSYIFAYCENLSISDIGKSIESIGAHAFDGCNNIPYVIIPPTLKRCEEKAFTPSERQRVEISDLEAWWNIDFEIFSNPLRSFNQDGELYLNGILVEEVTMPKNIDVVKPFLFEGASCLKKVILNENTMSIGQYAFRDCNHLSYIHLGKSLKEIGDFAFQYCKNLSSPSFPESLERIGTSAYNECNSITDLNIPDNVIVIEPNTFNRCTSLANLKLPAQINAIGEKAFAYCVSLDELNLPDNDVLIGRSAFTGCSLKELNLPDSVTFMSYDSFSQNEYLTNIRIGTKMKKMEEYVFNRCYNVRAVYCTASIPPSLSYWTFCDRIYKNAVLYVPDNSISEYMEAEGWKEFSQIEKLSISGVDKIQNDESSVIKIQNRVIEILADYCRLEIVSLSGTIVYKDTLRKGASLSLPIKSPCIIKANDKIYKIL